MTTTKILVNIWFRCNVKTTLFITNKPFKHLDQIIRKKMFSDIVYLLKPKIFSFPSSS